jgi:membrane protease YdiL (CAAX protease family)
MVKFFKNKWLIGGIIIYIASLAFLFQSKIYSIEEAIFALIIIGFFFSTVGWFTTKSAKVLEFSVDPTNLEILISASYVVFVFLYLIFGVSLIDAFLPKVWVENPQIFFLVKIIKKLLVFVIIPYVLISRFFGYSAKDFGFRKEALKEFFKSHLPTVLIISSLMVLLQFFIGNAASPIRQGEFTTSQILFALPLCFIALFVEVGLVEEFFYRVFLQSRFAAFFKSEVAGIVIVAMIFAVSHAPGLIFRQAGISDGLGATPNAWEAIAYTISTISLISIMFGIIWIRKRNLLALIFIHAMTDLLPNLPEFIRTWNL